MFLFINKMTINVCLTHISLNLRKSTFFQDLLQYGNFYATQKTFAIEERQIKP